VSAALDRRLLIARPDDACLWVWLGGRDLLTPTELMEVAMSQAPSGMRLAVGEAGHGLQGWRRSHHEARAAWLIAQRSKESSVRYADVAVLSSILQDSLVVDALRRLYLEPLEAERDGGETLRTTLRAYFAAGRGAASAAAILGVSRQAVSARLRMVETRIGRPLSTCASEFETALRVCEFAETSTS
jgi:DNA-binding PucR family transcriptional regulator